MEKIEFKGKSYEFVKDARCIDCVFYHECDDIYKEFEEAEREQGVTCVSKSSKRIVGNYKLIKQ